MAAPSHAVHASRWSHLNQARQVTAALFSRTKLTACTTSRADLMTSSFLTKTPPKQPAHMALGLKTPALP